MPHDETPLGTTAYERMLAGLDGPPASAGGVPALSPPLPGLQAPAGPQNASQPPTGVTSVDEWMAPITNGQLIRLPSGKTVRMVRTMDMMDMIRKGEIPNQLQSIVDKMIASGEGRTFDAEKDLDASEQTHMMNWIDDVVCAAVTEPKIVKPPADASVHWRPSEPGTISLAFVDPEDRMFIFQFAQGGTADVARFRHQAEAILGGVPGGGEVALPPERTPGPDNP
jgi:hypothetical protein